MRRYYQILGISPTASPQEIKEAWLFSLKAFHPDKFADASRHQQAIAEARTQAINEAYRVLSDPVSRSVYDRDYFRETSYKNPSSTIAPTSPPEKSSASQRSAPLAKKLLTGLLSSARRKTLRLATFVGLVIVAIVGLLFLQQRPPTNRSATVSEPPFTQIIIPPPAPTPMVVPTVAEKTPASQPSASPPAVFDLPKLAAVARRAVGLVLGFDAKDHVVQTGSGFFISADGEFVTNEHVIIGAKRMSVKMENGAHYVVKRTLASSSRLDLAILQIEGRDIPYLKLETASTPEVGTRIAVIGSPVALEGTLSDGIISAIRTKESGTWIQITAPISPGSSGSPVLNSAGEVVGIVTLGSKNGRVQNLNFARSSFDVVVLRQSISGASKLTTLLRELRPWEEYASPTPPADGTSPPPKRTATPTSSPPLLTLAQSPTPPQMLLPAPTPTPNDEPSKPSPDPSSEPSPQQTTYRVVGLPRSTPFLNIRAGPGANFAVVAVFTPKGRGITLGPGCVTNGTTVWQEVFSGEFRGWVNAQYLAPEKSAEQKPAGTPSGGHN